MPSLDNCFEELRRRLKEGEGLRNTGSDPVYYLIFRPDQMLDVKRVLKQWIARLKLDEWNVHSFSMADAVDNVLQNHPLREFWLQGEKDNPLDFETINKTLADALMANGALERQLRDVLDGCRNDSRALVLITDVEALHPYLRIGQLEQRLQGKFTAPTVILYPGTRTGEYTLRFLGIYPEDGNYRSMHISC